MEFEADTGIDNISERSTIVYTHVILVLEACDKWTLYVLCHRYVALFHRIVQSMNRIECLAHSERIYLYMKNVEVDYRISRLVTFEK